MNLDVKGFAAAAGVVWRLAVFLATLLAVQRDSGQHLRLLSASHLGCQVSSLGSKA